VRGAFFDLVQYRDGLTASGWGDEVGTVAGGAELLRHKLSRRGDSEPR